MKAILATDGSKTAEEAARFLARLPHTEHLELNVVAINYAPGVHSTIEIIGSLEGYLQAGRDHLDASCKRIAKMFDGANATIRTSVVDGHPGRTLTNLANEKGVDLFVVGATGHSALDRMLIGSVSDLVATHAKCSVLVVRPSLANAANQTRLRICYPYDDSRPSKNALDAFGRFSWKPNTDIDVIHVVRTPQIYSDIPIPMDTTALKEQAKKELERGVKIASIASETPVPHVLENDHTGDGIVQFATQHESDLIVLGDTGRGFLSRFFLGSVARYVLRHAPCSVWIGR